MDDDDLVLTGMPLGLCVKTDAEHGGKYFVNLCHSDKVCLPANSRFQHLLSTPCNPLGAQPAIYQ